AFCSTPARVLSFSFFFQAEDGIRDFHVTGVQTCALPISVLVGDARHRVHQRCHYQLGGRALQRGWRGVLAGVDQLAGPRPAVPRSEERRVGKEGRARWAPSRKMNREVNGVWIGSEVIAMS